ncbi:DUF2933 domain-containing protein [Paludibacterium purpuratum]|uniref:DUF2933 family protein n=1 Tax=Paludibacterium purpuratum TaxID=1144873 RepID=A0A4R7B275_9NEIS|nr:DUF2933 domain-containing protein [Paludibacterium purpuratum]TDR77829.1 DUF2933 family protein [Paludibacterium purpuratum]
MKSCCSNSKSRWPMVIMIGLLAVIAGLLTFGNARGASLAALPLLSVLICPLMMFVMMYLMPRQHDEKASANTDKS